MKTFVDDEKFQKRKKMRFLVMKKNDENSQKKKTQD